MNLWNSVPTQYVKEERDLEALISLISTPFGKREKKKKREWMNEWMRDRELKHIKVVNK